MAFLSLLLLLVLSLISQSIFEVKKKPINAFTSKVLNKIPTVGEK